MVENLALSADWVIRQVSSDVWRHIFGHLYQELRDSELPHAILYLSHVCSSWRAIVNNAPELWTRIYIKIFPPDCCVKIKLELLYLALQNSREIPLNMTFVADDSSSANARLVIEAGKLFFGAVKRANSLEMHGMEGFPWKEIEADIRTGETLETLSEIQKVPYNAETGGSQIWRNLATSDCAKLLRAEMPIPDHESTHLQGVRQTQEFVEVCGGGVRQTQEFVEVCGGVRTPPQTFLNLDKYF
ncbi:hypothetical protein CVT26_013749 [Gymnopilus dilepis]|uniref:F-box domain-containing protein n=1 Tax=Gymnopilus dilepis TaxID=231916 RepID=A0A409YWE4_9AGAR|nr:hypothetical protein CVT26_013749 [Gymnopilus dilepis]